MAFFLLEHGSKTTIQWFYKKTPALVKIQNEHVTIYFQEVCRVWVYITDRIGDGARRSGHLPRLLVRDM